MTPDEIIDETAHHFGLERAEVVGPSRRAPIVLGRHVAMFAIRERTTASLCDIGRLMNRDHKSVLHGVRKVRELLKCSDRRVQDALVSIDRAATRTA
jgi:chromosomal replication initiator protein